MVRSKMKSKFTASALAAAIIGTTGLVAGPAFAGESPLQAPTSVVEVAAENNAINVIHTLASDAIAGLTDETLSDDIRRQEYLALNYASQFKSFNGEQFVVGDESQQKKDTFVNSQFVRPDGPPVTIIWRLREFGDKYKIIDVTVEGLSMGITQRDEFTTVIQQNGGKVAALTKALHEKTGK